MSRLVQTCPVCRLPGVRRRSLPTCRHPCKSFVKGEKDYPDSRLGGARTIEAIRTRSSHVCLSAVLPAFAQPDIHVSLLSMEKKILLTRAYVDRALLKLLEQTVRNFAYQLSLLLSQKRTSL